MMLHGIVLDRGSSLSLRRQLVGHLESRILGGQIDPGRRLPSVRRAGELLGLHRNTVAAAYGDLVRRGLVHTRPGSGVYARSPTRVSDAEALATVRGPRDVYLDCSDVDLRTVLVAELRARLAVRVHRSDEAGHEVRIRLAPGAGFLRALHGLPRPSLVSVYSASERVQRLASVSVTLHGGDGIAYLPAIPGKRDGWSRAARLAALVAADYAALPWARHALPVEVVPLPLISECSRTELILNLGRRDPGTRRATNPPRRMERSPQTRVERP